MKPIIKIFFLAFGVSEEVATGYYVEAGEMNRMENEILQLRKLKFEQKDKIREAQREIYELKMKIYDLERKLGNQKMKINQLQFLIEDVRQEMAYAVAENKKLKKEITLLQNDHTSKDSH